MLEESGFPWGAVAADVGGVGVDVGVACGASVSVVEGGSRSGVWVCFRGHCFFPSLCPRPIHPVFRMAGWPSPESDVIRRRPDVSWQIPAAKVFDRGRFFLLVAFLLGGMLASSLLLRLPHFRD